MTGIKQSNFTQVTSVGDADNIPLFTGSENKRITYANMRDQLTDEVAVRFIYPTTAQLQQSNLEADEDEPNYVRCEETEYRLYKITALAAGVDDIALDNGMTATYQEEYSKSGFVLGAASSTNNALALFDGTTGAQLKTGAVLSTIGGNLASATSIAQVSYPRVDAANTVTMATPTALKTDLNLPSNTSASISNIESDISTIANDIVTIQGDIVDINADLADKVQTVETWADISTVAPSAAGQVFALKQHTSSGLGGGTLMAYVGSVADDGGTQKNCLGGFYLKRINYTDLTPSMFGAIGDGVADDTASFQLAVNKNLPIKITAGIVKITAPVTSTSNFVLHGDGDNCIIDASAVTGSALKVSGSLAALPAITDVAASAQSVTFTSAHGLAVNDVFVIYNPTDFSYSGFRSNYRAGEWCQVKSVSGLNVKLKSPLYAGYTGAAVNIYRLSSGVALFKGVKIVGANNQPIEISKVINPVVKDITVTCASDTAVYFDKCWMPLGDNCTVSNVGAGTDDYGIIFGSCQHAKITNSNIYARRHAVATGGDSAIGCVTNRDIRITTSTLRNDADSGTHCADFHGDTEGCSYENCNIYGGVTWQGKNNHYRSCAIYAMVVGTCVYSSEILGGNFSLVDCDLYTNVDPSASSRGVIDVGGNNDALTVNTTSDCTFIVKDCRINGTNFSNITAMMRVRVAGSTTKININYNGNEHKINDMGSPVLASVSSGSTAPDFIVVDNCAGIPAAKLLANLAGGFASAPMRMQMCSGSIASNTTTSSPAKQETATFRYTYPKEPVVSVTKSGRNYQSNRVGVAIADTITTTTALLGLYTDDAVNFGSTGSFTFNWSAEISEV